MNPISTELKENRPHCQVCRREVDYALLWTGGTESPKGKVAWSVTVRCHGVQYQEDFLMGRDMPDLKHKKFF
jgi:hypothetical protein